MLAQSVGILEKDVFIFLCICVYLMLVGCWYSRKGRICICVYFMLVECWYSRRGRICICICICVYLMSVQCWYSKQGRNKSGQVSQYIPGQLVRYCICICIYICIYICICICVYFMLAQSVGILDRVGTNPARRPNTFLYLFVFVIVFAFVFLFEFVFVCIRCRSSVGILDRVGTNLARRPNTFPVNLSNRGCRWNFNEYLSNAQAQEVKEKLGELCL